MLVMHSLKYAFLFADQGQKPVSYRMNKCAEVVGSVESFNKGSHVHNLWLAVFNWKFKITNLLQQMKKYFKWNKLTVAEEKKLFKEDQLISTLAF